jgi:hypothetical protein
MAACDTRLPSLIDAASGELPESVRRDLEAHLATCANCVAELAELRSTEKLLRATSDTPDDLLLSGFAVRVADRAEAFRDRSARGLWWSFTRAMRVTLAFSSTAVAASLALFVMSRQPVSLNQVPRDIPTGIEKGAPPQDLAADVTELASDDRFPDESLDSALDDLSTDELDELVQQMGSSEEG